MTEPRKKIGVEISKWLVLVNAASSVLSRALLIGILVGVNAHLVRRISQEEYAIYPVLMMLMVFFPLMITMFVSGLRRYVTEAYAQGDEERVTQLVSTMVPVLTKLALAVLVGGLVIAWRISDVVTIAPEYEWDAQVMFALLIAGVALRVFLAPFGFGFYILQKFLLRNLIGVGTELVRVGVLIVLLAYSTRVLWVVVAMVVAAVVELAVVTIVSRRLVPALRYRAREVRPDLRGPMLAFGGWGSLAQVAMLVRESADVLILNRMSTNSQVATFHLGAMLEGHARRSFLEAGTNAQPPVTALYATGQHERLRQTYLRLCRFSLWALLCIGMPLFIYRVEFFQLYARERFDEYSAAATVMGLLLARWVVIFPNAFVGMIAMAQARVRPVAIRASAISAVNLALTIYLVAFRGMGAVGSALATLLVTIVGAPLLFWTLGAKLVDVRLVRWVRTSVLPGLLPAVLAAPVWIGMRHFLPARGWGQFAVGVALGIVAYLVVLLTLALRQDDRMELAKLVGRTRRAFGAGPRTT